MRYCVKYCRAWQATEDNLAHAYCMLDNYGYTHVLIIKYLLLFHATMLPYTYIACLVIINVVLKVHKTIYLLKQIPTSLFIAIRLDVTYKPVAARVQ
jgi:hypothetical protein